MTTTDHPTLRLPPRPDGRHRFSSEEFFDMAERGFFEGQHVELIDGEIIHMARQNFPHMAAVSKIMELLPRAFGTGFWVTSQANIKFLEASAPEPDFCVVSASFLTRGMVPDSTFLVVEISDSSLQIDRDKASLYAAADVPEYWIVNLNDRVLEVHRNPIVNPAANFGRSYASVQGVANSIRPLARPEVEIQVADLLP